VRLSAGNPSAAQPREPVVVRLPITLGQFLKVAGIAGTGGEAKQLISLGEVLVNGCRETRRGRHLLEGDVVSGMGQVVTVATDAAEAERARGDHLATGRADRD